MTEAEYLNVKARTHVLMMQHCLHDILEEFIPWIVQTEHDAVQEILDNWSRRSESHPAVTISDDAAPGPSHAPGND